MAMHDDLQRQFPAHIIATHQYRGDATVVVRREGLLEVCRLLKTAPGFEFNVLMDVTAVDYLTFGQAAYNAPTLATPSPLPYFMSTHPTTEMWEPSVGAGWRFEVVYHLYSLTKNHRLRLKVPLPEATPAVPSLTALWAAANWYEREVWDMYGIRFDGHPNLTRILMYKGFDGHPLRKDYPVNKRQPLVGPVN